MHAVLAELCSHGFGKSQALRDLVLMQKLHMVHALGLQPPGILASLPLQQLRQRAGQVALLLALLLMLLMLMLQLLVVRGVPHGLSPRRREGAEMVVMLLLMLLLLLLKLLMLVGVL